MNAVRWRTLIMLAALQGLAIGPAGDPVAAQPSGVTVPGVVEGDVVEGRVSRAVPETRTITLDNGQEYLIPAALAPNWGALRNGAAVKLRYSVDRGRNVATLLEVRPPDVVAP